MIDTHCHLTFPGLHERVEQVIANAKAAGVDRIITVGTSPDDARRAIALADRHADVFAAVGLHPHDTAQWADRALVGAAIRELAVHPKVVALGEMGLDRHYGDPPIDIQRRGFAWQLELAAEISDLPVIIHNRQATGETVEMIRQAGLPGQRFVFHCFTGTTDELEIVLDHGAMVSFTGIVTFKNSGELAKTSDRVPIGRLLIETDSPYLSPEPHRKVRPNEPRYVTEVAGFLAARRGMPVDRFTACVDANAERFFRLRGSLKGDPSAESVGS